MQFEEEYSIMIKALKEAKEKVDDIATPDIRALKNRVAVLLQREINSLTQRTNAVANTSSTVRIPLTRFLGNDLPVEGKRKPEKQIKPVISKAKFVERSEETTQDVQGKELKTKAEKLYPVFTDLTNDQILDRFSHLEILAVAKMADLPVTEKTAVNHKFIEYVKGAINKKEPKEKVNENQD
jgi:hypothetical protein